MSINVLEYLCIIKEVGLVVRSVLLLSLFLSPLFLKFRSVQHNCITFDFLFYFRSIFSGRDDSCENSEISLLTGVQNISYTKLENLQIETIAIPFKDPNLALYIVLPSKGIMVTSIVSNPNKNLLLEIIQSMKPENVQYAIPKMKYSDNINQLELLKQDGLSNITEDDIADHLVLSNIQQKTEIDLNEDGIGIPKTENMDNNAPPTEVADASVIQFIVDRPYIFFIYNKLTKLFLYYGMVLKPEGYDE